jgi:hypothetical protein
MAPADIEQLTHPTERLSQSVQAVSHIQLPLSGVIPVGQVRHPLELQVEQGEGQLTVTPPTR